MQVRAQSGATKGYYALLYKYVPDILEKVRCRFGHAHPLVTVWWPGRAAMRSRQLKRSTRSPRSQRGPYREQHLAGARQMLDAGKMVMAGALAEPVDGALFIFKDVTKVTRGTGALSLQGARGEAR